MGFTAAHVRPIVAGLAFDGGAWWWGSPWCLRAPAGAVPVTRVRASHRRPTAPCVTGSGAMVAPLVAAPDGTAWPPVVLLLELVVAHSVPEGAGSTADGGGR